ncbi:MAG: biotin transporter BioY [Clostridium sp.]|nr:biotin transporter BioY [Clostridium sp.]
MKLTVKEMVLIALGAAIMAVFSQISFPLPFTTVPITLQVFGVVAISVILEEKISTISLIIFTLLGAIGIPVYSNFSAGIGVLFGPTGGYIIGFIFMAYIVGFSAGRYNKAILVVGTYIGVLIEYIFGVLQLKLVLGLTLEQALVSGLYPFIIKDVIVTALGIMVALIVKKRIKRVVKIGAKS